MENTPINLEIILEQACDWTFDGDFQILQWMNKISQNLEAKATTTTENLDRLNNNVKSTHIALDNVANSLTALQYGNQFVECRVQDDDETSMSGGNEGFVANGIDTSAKPSSKEILTTFLDNNLKVLRNCHEKYSIDLDDSDEEDEMAQKTYIFQPINPYNEKPLPHIFGSKEWCEKWHVGLSYDEKDNTYSGDELSEAYSESSSCSAPADNDSYETNSEFASSVSLNTDNFAGSNLERNVSTLRRSKIEAVSETSSTHSSAAKLSTRNIQSHDLIEEIHGATSSLSSSQSKTDDSLYIKDANTTATSVRHTKTPPSNIPPYVDLFAEPPEDLGSMSSTPSLVDQTLHKPGNIFNDDVDDVFKHLAIAQSKRSDPPVARERTNVKPKSNPVEQTSNTSKMNASDETKVPHSAVSVAPNNNTEYENQLRAGTIASKSRTPINLFDDDDDDEDFLSSFVKKHESFGNPKLLENPSVHSNTFSAKEDIFKTSTRDVKASFSTEITDNKNRNSKERSEPQIDKAQNKFINLFDDVEDEDLVIVTQKPPNIMQTSTKVIGTYSDSRENNNIAAQSLANIMKSTNLFDDDDDDDEDFFKTLPSIKSSVTSQIVNKNEEELVSSSMVVEDFCKKESSIDLTENRGQKNKSSTPVVHTNWDVDTKNDFLKTLSVPSVENQVVDKTKIKTSSGLLTESFKDDDNDGDDFLKLVPSISKQTSIKGDLNISSVMLVTEKSKIDDDFFENRKSTDPSIVKHSADYIEDNKLPQTSTDIKAIAEGGRKAANQNTINNLFDDTDKDNVLAPEYSEFLETQPVSDNKILEDINAFNKSGTVKSKNIREDEKDTSKAPVIFKTANTMENVLEGITDMPNNTSIDFDTNRDIYLDQESLLNKGSKEKPHKTYTAETESERNSRVDHQKNKEHMEFNVENTEEPNEQLSIENSLHITTQKESTSLTDGLLNVNTPTMPQYSVDPNKEVLNKSDSALNNSKVEKSQKYDLTSSFLFDEPPDDDDNDFFDSLGKSSIQSITKYNSFDLENDLYPEPKLPKIPNAEMASSAYAGLQLFDDIPPEDDGFQEVMSQKPEITKRLNTVFYDDLHETLAALNGNHATISTHSILDNEPTPNLDNDQTELGAQNKDVVDFLKPVLKTGDNSEPSSHTKDINAHAKPAGKEEDTSKPINTNRPISKLQLPNIKINVESLLPYVGGVTPSMKMPGSVGKNIGTETASTPIVSNTNIAPRSIETSHILPNVNKTRVRAPLNRRPSTRKARIENYRKSLLDEELLSNDDGSHQENNKRNSEVQQKPVLENKLQRLKTFENSNVQIIKHSEPPQSSFKSHHHIDNVNTEPSTTSKVPNVEPHSISHQKTLLFTDTEELDIANEQISNMKSILAEIPKMLNEQENDENGKGIANVNTAKMPNENAASLQNIVSNQPNWDATKNPLKNLMKPQHSNKREARLLPQNISKEKLVVTKSANDLKASTKMLFTDSESDDDLFLNLSTTKPKSIEPTNQDSKLNTVESDKSLETKKAPINKTKTSLFSDDSDEDDDFLTTRSKTKVVPQNKPKGAPATKSIFSDIEDSDDGDLFGGNSKVTNKQSLNTTQTNAAEPKRSNKQTIADNPLADLL